MEVIIFQGSAWKDTKCYATMGLLILLLLYVLIDEILINGKAALLPPPQPQTCSQKYISVRTPKTLLGTTS